MYQQMLNESVQRSNSNLEETVQCSKTVAEDWRSESNVSEQLRTLMRFQRGNLDLYRTMNELCLTISETQNQMTTLIMESINRGNEISKLVEENNKMLNDLVSRSKPNSVTSTAEIGELPKPLPSPRLTRPNSFNRPNLTRKTSIVKK